MVSTKTAMEFNPETDVVVGYEGCPYHIKVKNFINKLHEDVRRKIKIRDVNKMPTSHTSPSVYENGNYKFSNSDTIIKAIKKSLTNVSNFGYYLGKTKMVPEKVGVGSRRPRGSKDYIPQPGWGGFSASKGNNRAGNAIPCRESANWLYRDRSPNIPRKKSSFGKAYKGMLPTLKKSFYDWNGRNGFQNLPKSIYDSGNVPLFNRSPYGGAPVGGALPRPYGPRDNALIKGYPAMPVRMSSFGPYMVNSYDSKFGSGPFISPKAHDYYNFGMAPVDRKSEFRPHANRNWKPIYQSYANSELYLPGQNPYSTSKASKKTVKAVRAISRRNNLSFGPNNVGYRNPILMYDNPGGNTYNFLTGRNYYQPCNPKDNNKPLKVKKNNNPTGYLAKAKLYRPGFGGDNPYPLRPVVRGSLTEELPQGARADKENYFNLTNVQKAAIKAEINGLEKTNKVEYNKEDLKVAKGIFKEYQQDKLTKEQKDNLKLIFQLVMLNSHRIIPKHIKSKDLPDYLKLSISPVIRQIVSKCSNHGFELAIEYLSKMSLYRSKIYSERFLINDPEGVDITDVLYNILCDKKIVTDNLFDKPYTLYSNIKTDIKYITMYGTWFIEKYNYKCYLDTFYNKINTNKYAKYLEQITEELKGKMSNPASRMHFGKQKPWVSNKNTPYTTSLNGPEQGTGYKRVGQPLELYTYQNTPYGGYNYPEFSGPRQWLGGYGNKTKKVAKKKVAKKTVSYGTPRPGDTIILSKGKMKILPKVSKPKNKSSAPTRVTPKKTTPKKTILKKTK